MPKVGCTFSKPRIRMGYNYSYSCLVEDQFAYQAQSVHGWNYGGFLAGSSHARTGVF